MFGKIILATICSLIFGYYAFETLVDYLSYQTVSHQSLERQESQPIPHICNDLFGCICICVFVQESQPLPQICIASPALAQERLEQFGLTAKEYEKEGIWRSSDGNYSKFNEEQIKKIISPELNDLMVKIKVRSRIKDDSDRYKTETFIPTEILNGTKVDLVKLDYYDYYAIFCFLFSKEGSFPFGIEKVFLYLKHKSKVFVVSPGNFYTFERKRNAMIILPDVKYDYQVLLK